MNSETRNDPLEVLIELGFVDGKTIERLRDAGLDVLSDIEREACTPRRRLLLAHKSGLPARVLRTLYQAVELRAIGLNMQIISLLLELGVTSVDELAKQHPHDLAAALYFVVDETTLQDANILVAQAQASRHEPIHVAHPHRLNGTSRTPR